VLAATGTIQYDLWKNVLSRLEVRWDHALDSGNAFGGSAPTPVGTDSLKRNNFMVAANLIYKF